MRNWSFDLDPTSFLCMKFYQPLKLTECWPESSFLGGGSFSMSWKKLCLCVWGVPWLPSGWDFRLSLLWPRLNPWEPASHGHSQEKKKSFFLIHYSELRSFNKLVMIIKGFPDGSDGKESACSAGDLGLIPVLERVSGEGHGNPLQYSCLETPHGQRGLAGYSPRGHKESDTTEWLSTHGY